MSRSDKIIVTPGTKYNHLTFLREAEPYITPSTKHKVTMWVCQCDCENQTIITTRATAVRNGTTKSCGCIQKKKAKENMIKNHKKTSLKGQNFGNLEVLEGTQNRLYNEIVWKCKCHYKKENGVECGNIFFINTSGVYTKDNCGQHFIRSKGENKIVQILNENNISFEKEKKFSTCLSVKQSPLKFDFYVNNSYIIEYDGEQHFQYYENGSWGSKDEWNEARKNDRIKDQWCKDNGIPLIRIPYTRYNTLELKDLLLDSSSFIVNN